VDPTLSSPRAQETSELEVISSQRETLPDLSNGPSTLESKDKRQLCL